MDLKQIIIPLTFLAVIIIGLLIMNLTAKDTFNELMENKEGTPSSVGCVPLKFEIKGACTNRDTIKLAVENQGETTLHKFKASIIGETGNDIQIINKSINGFD